jgi:hypothetical protein
MFTLTITEVIKAYLRFHCLAHWFSNLGELTGYGA